MINFDYASVIGDRKWLKTGNCPHQSNIKAFFQNRDRMTLQKKKKACGRVLSAVCVRVCALMRFYCFRLGRGIAGPCFTVHV